MKTKGRIKVIQGTILYNKRIRELERKSNIYYRRKLKKIRKQEFNLFIKKILGTN